MGSHGVGRRRWVGARGNVCRPPAHDRHVAVHRCSGGWLPPLGWRALSLTLRAKRAWLRLIPAFELRSLPTSAWRWLFPRGAISVLGMGGQAASAPASKGAEGGGRMRSIPHGVDIPEGQGCRVVGAAGAGSHGVAEAWPAALVGGWSGLASGNDDPSPPPGYAKCDGTHVGVAPAAAQRLARHRTAPRTGRPGHSTPPSHAPSPWRAPPGPGQGGA